MAKNKKSPADLLKQAARAYTEENPEKAADCLNKAARLGSSSARFCLGMLCLLGEGVERDISKAVQLFQKASEKLYAPALSAMEYCILHASGTPQAPDEYDKWQRKAVGAWRTRGFSSPSFTGNTREDTDQLTRIFLADLNQDDLSDILPDVCDTDDDYPQRTQQPAKKLFQHASELCSNCPYRHTAACTTCSDFVTVQYQGKPLTLPNNKVAGYFEQEAAQGSAEAMGYLSQIYRKGVIVPKDQDKSLAWLRKAADCGDGFSLVNLAVLYANGKSVPQDYQKARQLLEKAVKLNIPQAFYYLGLQYNRGSGVAINYEKAASLYRTACVYDNPDAMVNLGDLYQEGLGVCADLQKAAELYARADKLGNAYAAYRLGCMYLSDKGGVTQDTEKGIALLTRAAEQGCNDAMISLGDRLYDGTDVAQDYQEALSWYRRASRKGLARADGRIARMYLGGQGLPKNVKKAVTMLEDASSRGDADARYSLGRLHYSGRGVPQDYTRAASLFALAADQGNRHARYALALQYLYGQGVACAPDRAARLLYSVAKQGDRQAKAHLGLMHAIGLGVRQNDSLARDFTRQAAGEPAASLALGILAERTGNFTEAESWYRKAADPDPSVNPNITAQALYQLGKLCQDGALPGKDLSDATVLYQQSAALGWQPAMTALHIDPGSYSITDVVQGDD